MQFAVLWLAQQPNAPWCSVLAYTWCDWHNVGCGRHPKAQGLVRGSVKSQARWCDVQTLGGGLWPLPDAINRLGPVHSVLLKKLVLQSVGAAVAAFSLKV